MARRLISHEPESDILHPGHIDPLNKEQKDKWDIVDKANDKRKIDKKDVRKLLQAFVKTAREQQRDQRQKNRGNEQPPKVQNQGENGQGIPDGQGPIGGDQGEYGQGIGPRSRDQGENGQDRGGQGRGSRGGDQGENGQGRGPRVGDQGGIPGNTGESHTSTEEYKKFEIELKATLILDWLKPK